MKSLGLSARNSSLGEGWEDALQFAFRFRSQTLLKRSVGEIEVKVHLISGVDSLGPMLRCGSRKNSLSAGLPIVPFLLRLPSLPCSPFPSPAAICFTLLSLWRTPSPSQRLPDAWEPRSKIQHSFSVCLCAGGSGMQPSAVRNTNRTSGQGCVIREGLSEQAAWRPS